jgi:hypothetical protein
MTSFIDENNNFIDNFLQENNLSYINFPIELFIKAEYVDKIFVDIVIFHNYNDLINNIKNRLAISFQNYKIFLILHNYRLFNTV